LLIHRPGTLQEVCEVTERYRQHYNQERPHQGRSCQNQPPRIAFPSLPVLPPLPEQVDPDRWLERLHGQAFARRINSHGFVEVNHEPYYIKQALAGQSVVLMVNAPEQLFEIRQESHLLKQLPIKGLYGQALPFERYVTLIKQEARSEQRRRSALRPSSHQFRLWD
jgi:hypothetical protein